MIDAEKQSLFRECFNTSVGRKVLGIMLVELDYFSYSKSTPEDMARSNFAAKLLHYLGIASRGNEEVVANGLMEMNFIQGEKND